MTPDPASPPSRRLPGAPGGLQDDAEDRRLVACVCAHELAAFETLYRRYHPRLSRFLHRMLRPEHLVEEVLDDTLYVVWNQAERFNGTSKVSTWIFAIAYRKALKALSRHDDPLPDAAEDDQPAAAAERPEARMSPGPRGHRPGAARAVGRPARRRRAHLLPRLQLPGNRADRRVPHRHRQDADVPRAQAPESRLRRPTGRLAMTHAPPKWPMMGARPALLALWRLE
jgi:RNA polymerase sigma factor (sigma-70 family)